MRQHQHLLEHKEAGVPRLVKLEVCAGGDCFTDGRKGGAFQQALLREVMRAKIAPGDLERKKKKKKTTLEK